MKHLGPQSPRPSTWRVSLLVLASITAAVSSVSAGGVRLPVFVTIDPQAFFVERIGGERVAVSVLVGPGQCAETFEPNPKQMTRLGEAKLFFTLGMPMEQTLLPRIRSNFPDLTVIDTQAGIPLRRLDGDILPGADTHHAPDPESSTGEAEHRDEGADPHVWLDPRLAKILSRSICEGLVRTDPAGETFYRRNLASLEADLDTADADVRRILSPVQGRTMLVYHPYYGYFVEAYGLRQASIEVGGFQPGSKYLASLVDLTRKEGSHAVFVQLGASVASAETVAKEIGGRVITLDPMSRDYLNNLRQMAWNIREGLGQ